MADSGDIPASIDAPQRRVAAIIEALCRVMAADSHARGLAGPLVVLIFTRLRRLAARFAATLARTPAPGHRRPARPRDRRDPPPQPVNTLPRNFGWLRTLLPGTSGAASQLAALLADPEMTALIAAHPAAGRALRPLCHLLGVRPPQALRLAKRPALAAPEPSPERAQRHSERRAQQRKTAQHLAWLTGHARVTPPRRPVSARP